MRKPIWSNGSPVQEITPGLSSADGTNAGFCLAAKDKAFTHQLIEMYDTQLYVYMYRSDICECMLIVNVYINY